MGAMLGAFMAVLDIQITNASLKEIQGIGLPRWRLLISTSIWLLKLWSSLTGWLARVFSTRWYLVVNAALFIFFPCAVLGMESR